MRGSSVMQGSAMPTRKSGPIVTAVLAIFLVLVVIPLVVATDSVCDGSDTDAGGYACTQPSGGNMVPDISSEPGVSTVTSWKPKGCTGDDCYSLVALGSSFTWYGNSYAEAYVGSNGYLSFGAGYTNEVSTDSIPATPSPNNTVYAYGDDLDPSAGGTIYYMAKDCTTDRDSDGTNDSCFVVQWNAIPHYDAALTVTVRLALNFDTNEAIVEIGAESGGASGTHPRLVGAENLGGTAGLWYKAAGDTDSRSATVGSHFVFSSDTADPSVSGTDPGHGNLDVPLSKTVRVIFDESMDTASVYMTVLSGTDPGSWTKTWPQWDPDNKIVDFSNGGFADSERVVLQVRGMDVAGNSVTLNNRAGHGSCEEGYCWYFNTIDLTSPADVTKLTSAATDLSVTTDWAASVSADISKYLVLRRAGAAVNAGPTDGQEYTVGETIGVGNDVVCVVGDGGGGSESCTDNAVTNGQTYYYKVFAYDGDLNYAGGVSRKALPRSDLSFKFAYTTDSSTLAPVGVVSDTYVVGTGNDRLLHRMRASDGTWNGWIPPTLGGWVQSRPKVGDLDLGAGTDYTAFVTAQNGYVYRYSLTDGTTAAEGSMDAITGAGCASGLLQGGPVVMLEDVGNNGIAGDEGVILATRCGATNNKILIYDLAVTTEESNYGGGSGGLGICNSSPEILYMYEASRKNLVYVAVRDDGGESMVVLEVTGDSRFVTPPYAVITGAGDIDASPAFARRGSDRDDWHVVIGNTAGELYIYNTTSRVGGAGSSLSNLDSYADASGDGPVKGISISTGVAVSPSYENWVVWTTDSKIHGIKIGTDGRFVTDSYWTATVDGVSTPLVLRGVGGGVAIRAYVGSSDGKLYEFDATSGSVVSSPTVESSQTIGDPTFDYADGSSQGVVVGSSAGTYHWVVID